MAKKLSVKLFGGFSASYDGQVLTFGRQSNSKFGQLFQLLMTRPGQEFSKRDVIRELYGQREVEDPNATLNNTVFRLRKYLAQSPLPSGEYLAVGKGTVCFLGGVDVESDAWSLEKLADAFSSEQDGRRKRELCEQACELYRGELLPQLSNEQWVIQQNRHYRKLHMKMLRYLLGYLKQMGRYHEMEKHAFRASKLHPYGEWEIWRIDSLMALGRHKEAIKVYQEAVNWVQDLGDSPSKVLLERFYEVGRHLQMPDGTREGVYQCLAEEMQPQGAYCCTIPGFADCFRMLKRIGQRENIPFGLLLCTILGADGRQAQDRGQCERQGEKLRAVFRERLRVGDVYAKYNAGQYLLLCVGMAAENALEMGARIDAEFQKRCGRRYGIHCQMLDDSWDLWEV